MPLKQLKISTDNAVSHNQETQEGNKPQFKPCEQPCLSLKASWKGENTRSKRSESKRDKTAGGNGDSSHLPTVNPLQDSKRTHFTRYLLQGAGEVGGSQQVLRCCIPTAVTCIFPQCNNNLIKRVDWQMPSKTLQKDKKSHRKARLCNFLKDKREHVHYKQTHLHIPHTHAPRGSPLTLSVPLIKKKI